MIGVRLLGITALGASLVLGCSGHDEGPAATLLPAATASSSAAASSPSGAHGSVAAEPSAGAWRTGSAPSAGSARTDTAGAVRSSPMQTLNQMLTAQALLVSLLLAPVSKDVGQAPMARLEQPVP